MTEHKKRSEPVSPNFHARMMNVQVPTANLSPRTEEAYHLGHRDARHQCAEIALEADRRIEQLEAALRDGIDTIAMHQYPMGESDTMVVNHTEAEQWVLRARKALEQ